MPGQAVRLQGSPPGHASDEESLGSRLQALLPDILTVIRDHTGRDFSDYRVTTVLRRLRRRMRVLGEADPDGYLGRLLASPAETRTLADELLITVSGFFRDPSIWRELERRVLPGLLDRARARGCFRVWSAGCASGEEVYSVAMTILDAVRPGEDLRVEILATDLHEGALRRAAAGRYRADIADSMSADRLAGYFRSEETGFRVASALRPAITFRRHDLVHDPAPRPFDLILCRNVLIYLQRGAQRAVVRRLHEALVSGGVLMLGRSETVWDEDLFLADHRRQRLFPKRAGATWGGTA